MLLPLITGILLQEFFPANPVISFISIPMLGTLSAGLLLFLFSYLLKSPLSAYRFRFCFGLALFLCLSSLGMGCHAYHPSSSPALTGNSLFMRLHLESDPVKKANSFVCSAQVSEIRDSSMVYPTRLPLILYFPAEAAVQELKTGDILFGFGSLNAIRNSGNPHEFDYKGWMHRQGIDYRGYLTEWKIQNSRAPDYSVRNEAARLRKTILRPLERDLPRENIRNFIGAITLGERSTLSEDLREDFSDTGLSHILAVSGLHTGILFLLLTFLFRPLTWIRGQRLSFLLIIGCLWGYALIAGWSASVIRAVMMLTILLGARLLYEKNDSINTLCAVAFGMLFLRPDYLFEPGFQLSFSAFLSILLFYAPIRKGLDTKYRFLNRISDLITVTMAAQILTLPITIYYFNSFPLWFLPANLLITPLLMPYMGLSLFYLIWNLFTPTPLWINQLLETTTDLLLKFIHELASLPSPKILSELFPELGELILFLILGTALFSFLVKKKATSLIVLLGSVICWMLFFFPQPAPAETEVWILNHREGSSVQIIEGGRLHLFCGDSLRDTLRLEKILYPLCARNHIGQRIYYNTDTARVTGRGFRISPPFMEFGEERWMLLTDNRFRSYRSTTPLFTDRILLGNRFSEEIASLSLISEFREIIFLPTLPAWKTAALMRECDSLNIPYHNIRTQGALQFRIPHSIED